MTHIHSTNEQISKLMYLIYSAHRDMHRTVHPNIPIKVMLPEVLERIIHHHFVRQSAASANFYTQEQYPYPVWKVQYGPEAMYFHFNSPTWEIHVVADRWSFDPERHSNAVIGLGELINIERDDLHSKDKATL